MALSSWTKIFEQLTISNQSLGDTLQWLKDDINYNVIFYKGQPVTVEPPTFLELKIIETTPGDRGNTASGRVLKPAITETGAKIQVPIFTTKTKSSKSIPARANMSQE